MFFLAVILAAKLASTPPVILARMETLDKCELAVLKANSDPQLNTPEAKADGATAVCLIVHQPSY